MPNFPPITWIIYDLDGLLLDTECLHDQVNDKIAQRYGKVFTREAKAKITGRNSFDTAQILIALLDLPITPQDYIQQRAELVYRLYPQVQPLAGAMKLTQHFWQQGIGQAIATSSSQKSFGLKLQNHQEWLQIFNCYVLGDDPELKQGKPAPDIFLLTAKRLGAKPEQCLVFEDSVAGTAAALAAGMSVVAVPDAVMDKGLFQGAQEILASLNDFSPSRWGLPEFVLAPQGL